MRRLILILYIFAMIAIVLTLGCESGNPICNDFWCVEGKVYPRSELSSEVFDEVNVETSDVLATLGGVPPVETTPVETPETSEVSLSDIITDAAAGGTEYVGQTVTVEATVVWRSKNREAIIIYTSNDFEGAIEEGAGFFIFSLGNPARLNPYIVGNTYEFSVTIFRIDPPDDTLAIYKVRSELVE